VQRMIELKYVPCGIHTLCCLASAINGDQPVLDMDWVMDGGGHPPIASITEIKAIAESMELQSRRVWSKVDITKALSDNHMKKIEQAGFVPLSAADFSDGTKRNYLAFLSNQANVSISQSKLMTRQNTYSKE
jgi:hypothetical protein